MPGDKFDTDPNATINFTLNYLNDFDDILVMVKTGDELVECVEKIYPLTAMRFGLNRQARFMFPDSCSDHITPVPGIFHNPDE